MRKLTWLLLLLVILTAVPNGAAFASPEETSGEEVVVGKFIFEGYWDVWGANGKWVSSAYPGQKNLSVDSDVVYPSGWAEGSRGLKDLLRRYELTRAEVIAVYPMTEDQYNDAGKRYDKPWGGPRMPGFYTEDYARMPDNPRAEIKSFDPKTGATVVKWTIDYPQKPNPSDPKSEPQGPEGKAANTKDWLVHGEWDKIDLRFASKTDLDKIRTNEALEGWRVYFPAIVWWYGIPKPEVNLVAVSIKPGTLEPEPGKQYEGTVTFENRSTMALTQVPVAFFNGRYRGYLLDDAGNVVTRADFAPGERKTFKFKWTAPGSGTVTLKGVIDTPPLPDEYAETDESDNIIEVQLSVTAPPPASVGKGTLTLSAVSQSRTIKRPPGTAKWTDWVTATFIAPPAPDLSPCYHLKEWRIESATITYPKKHPWFTFGSPWPPQGTKTIPMKIVSDTKAVVEFQEDWSLNGAQVYARYVNEDYGEIVDEGMVPGPTNYPITVNYKMRWEYEKGHLDCCGEEECSPCCVDWEEYVKHPTGSVTAQLLVNGTGVNSVAG